MREFIIRLLGGIPVEEVLMEAQAAIVTGFDSATLVLIIVLIILTTLIPAIIVMAYIGRKSDRLRDNFETKFDKLADPALKQLIENQFFDNLKDFTRDMQLFRAKEREAKS